MSSPKRSPDSRTYPEWTDLPIELTAVIANHLTSIRDYLSFRGVCNLWRSAATFDNFNREFPRVPLLMYVTREERTCIGPPLPRIAHFLDLSIDKTYKIFNFPPTGEWRFLSCSGWILTYWDFDVYLTHPVWRIKIELPGLNTLFVNKYNNSHSAVLNRYYISPSAVIISKMVLSSSPTLKTDLVVMVIWGRNNRLGFCRPGDSSWTVMASWDNSFSDIIYHNGRFYALDDSWKVVECNIYGPNPTEIRQVFNLPVFEPERNLVLAGKPMLYLVETSGKFWIICRLYNHVQTVSFKVFELNLADGTNNEVHDMGHKALFLGFNASICLEISDLNEVKPNCIYFTDHLGHVRDRDVNAFCLSDGSFTNLVHGIFRSMCAPMTWVAPSI